MNDDELIDEARVALNRIVWTHETPALKAAIDRLEVLSTPEPELSDKVIREFHGNNVWRDSEGVIWMRLDEHTPFKAVAPVEVTRDISEHEFNLAADAFYKVPTDHDLNDQGMRRLRLHAAFDAIGFRVYRRDGEDKNNG